MKLALVIDSSTVNPEIEIMAASSFSIVPNPKLSAIVIVPRIGAGNPTQPTLLRSTLISSSSSTFVSPFTVTEMVLVSFLVPVKLRVPLAVS